MWDFVSTNGMNYYSHTCKCGCGELIEIKEHHKYKGIPLYKNGGHSRRNKTSWNKGLTKENCNLIIEMSLKSARTQKMNPPKGMKGKKHSKETIEKIKLGNLGKIVPKEVRLKISKKAKERLKDPKKNPMYGKHGKNNPNWSGGKSLEEYGFEFNKELKDKVKQRDMYTCQTPNCMNIDCLDVHHIDYNKKNNSLDNLTTLCHSCHAKTNGKKNRQYWTNYYQEILNVYL